MYESPITMITRVHDDIAKRFTEQTDNMVYEEVTQIGVHVDKEELLKALQYDRGQYEKGYDDARAEFMTAIRKEMFITNPNFNTENLAGLERALKIIKGEE